MITEREKRNLRITTHDAMRRAKESGRIYVVLTRTIGDTTIHDFNCCPVSVAAEWISEGWAIVGSVDSNGNYVTEE